MDAGPEPEGHDVLGRYMVAVLPQIVFRLDDRGRVIEAERFCADGQLASVRVVRGRSVHRCLHPHCTDAGCALLACIRAAYQRIAEVRMLEWEQADAIPGLVLRLALRAHVRAVPAHSSLTVTDISEGRRLTGSLRAANEALTAVIDRTSAEDARRINRLDRKLRSLSAELIIAQEGERSRIAADLHDGLGQWLSMAKLALEAGIYRLAPGDGAARDELDRAYSHLETAIREVRAIASNLRPSMLEEFGLSATLELLCHQLQLSQPAMRINCRVDGDGSRLGPDQSVAMVRILQEALHNVARHARASTVEVAVDFEPGSATLRVRDDGAGFNPAASGRRRAGGIGLQSMRRRARQSGGRLRVQSDLGLGTLVLAKWQHDGGVSDLESGTYKAIRDGEGGDGGGVA
ncbi:MAG: sensor histidine kinase [Steroidobacteraceae bacterium]